MSRALDPAHITCWPDTNPSSNARKCDLSVADERRKMGVRRWGGMVGSIVQKKTSDPIMENFTADTELSRDDFRELLRKIDAGLRALPATAQVRCCAPLEA